MSGWEIGTVEDVADYTKMSTKWVYRHALELGALKLGSNLRFRRADVDAYLARRSLAPRKRRGAA